MAARLEVAFFIDTDLACSRLWVVGDEGKRARKKTREDKFSLIFSLALPFFSLPNTESLEQANTDLTAFVVQIKLFLC